MNRSDTMTEAWAVARRRNVVYGEPLRAALATALRAIYQTRRFNKAVDAEMAAKANRSGGVRSAMSSGYDAPIDPMKLARITQ
jgi:hypothetical protein